MTDVQPLPGLDVFLSYKREEKEVAEGLANFLTTKGYDVWWDAALLAGEDFAKIVQAELAEARAVVVLWSRQARTSHWVRAEAALALANGTLINAVIDDMAFVGIPPEFSSIQAVRLGADTETFYQTIADAIARKVAAPAHTRRSSDEAKEALAEKVKDADHFRIIANSTDAADFREYLELFGETAQFAGLAKRKVATLEKLEAERKGIARKLKVGAVAGAGVIAWMVTVGANFSDVLTFLGFQVAPVQEPDVTPAPEPDPWTAENIVASPPDIGTGTTVAAAPEIGAGADQQTDTPIVPPSTLDDPGWSGTGSFFDGGGLGGTSITDFASLLGDTAGLTIIRPDFTVLDTLGASVSWAPSFDSSYGATISFPSGEPTLLSFSEPSFGLGGGAQLHLNVSGGGPLVDMATIHGLTADGVPVPGTSYDLVDGLHSYSLPEAGQAADALNALAAAKEIRLDLSFKNGDTGTLVVTKPAGTDHLRNVLFAQRATADPFVFDSFDFATQPQGQ
jgi:hypothetical protein